MRRPICSISVKCRNWCNSDGCAQGLRVGRGVRESIHSLCQQGFFPTKCQCEDGKPRNEDCLLEGSADDCVQVIHGNLWEKILYSFTSLSIDDTLCQVCHVELGSLLLLICLLFILRSISFRGFRARDPMIYRSKSRLQHVAGSCERDTQSLACFIDTHTWEMVTKSVDLNSDSILCVPSRLYLINFIIREGHRMLTETT